MTRFFYSMVRCVPEPRTGEFINVGAIAGSSDTNDWEIRQINNLRRAAKLCSPQHLSVATQFIAEITEQIDQAQDVYEPLPMDWLNTMRCQRRNVVQLSEPQVADGETAEDVLDMIFQRLVVDREPTARGFVTKNNLISMLRRAYDDDPLADLVHERLDLVIGESIRTKVDFAVGRIEPVQLTQAWSFQIASVDNVATEIKAWGYALRRLRDGEVARAVDRREWHMRVPADVAIDVSFASPKTPQQEDIFGEASEVFSALGARTYSGVDGISGIADHAFELAGITT